MDKKRLIELPHTILLNTEDYEKLYPRNIGFGDDNDIPDDIEDISSIPDERKLNFDLMVNESYLKLPYDEDSLRWIGKYMNHFEGAWLDKIIFEYDPETKIVIKRPPVIIWEEEYKMAPSFNCHRAYYLRIRNQVLRLNHRDRPGEYVLVFNEGHDYIVSKKLPLDMSGIIEPPCWIQHIFSPLGTVTLWEN